MHVPAAGLVTQLGSVVQSQVVGKVLGPFGLRCPPSRDIFSSSTNIWGQHTQTLPGVTSAEETGVPISVSLE